MGGGGKKVERGGKSGKGKKSGKGGEKSGKKDKGRKTANRIEKRRIWPLALLCFALPCFFF